MSYRFQELEEALSLAEQHLDEGQSQSLIDELQQQVDQLRTDLKTRNDAAERLHQDLKAAEHARQQAAEQLSAATRHQHSLQV